MITSHAKSRVRNNSKGGYNTTLPKHLGDKLELNGTEQIERTVTEYEDGSLSCDAIIIFNDEEQ